MGHSCAHPGRAYRALVLTIAAGGWVLGMTSNSLMALQIVAKRVYIYIFVIAMAVRL